MPGYRYLAIDARGQRICGHLECANITELEARLNRQGQHLLRLRAPLPSWLARGRQTLSPQETISLCLLLTQITSAGVPLPEGLSDLCHTLPAGPLRNLVADLSESIQSGQMLSAAARRHPAIFTPIMVSLMEAGELSGELPRILKQMTDTLKWEDELRAQFRKLLTYPAFAGSVVLGVTLFLLLYLVPKLGHFLLSMSAPLPWPTRAVLGLSHLLSTHGLQLLGVLTLLSISLSLWLRHSPNARGWRDHWLLRLWIVGPVLHKTILARFTGFLALMYRAGTPLLEALQLAQHMVGNQGIAQAIHQTRERILAGQTIGDSFASSQLFPPLVLRMVRLGESTGGLDEALMQVNYFYEREVNERIARLQALIEPILSLLLGLLLGGIMFAVLGPLYDVLPRIRQ